MVPLSLVHNLSLLVSMCLATGLLMRWFKRSGWGSRLLMGFLFGVATMVGMATPVVHQSGLFFDGRSIVLGIAGLFGGPWVAALAAIIASLFRFHLGGIGTPMGVLVIVESAFLGALGYYFRPRWKGLVRPLGLLALGLLIHLLMLALMVLLPGGLALDTLGRLGVAILLIYPAGFTLVGLAFLELEQHFLTEDALRASEAKFRTLFEQSPVGLAMVDHATGAFLEVNEAVYRPTGYTKEAFVKLSYWDITPREYEAQEQAQIEALNQVGRFGPNEKEYIRKDGSRYPILISGFLLTEADGRKVVWGLIEDITERKQATEALRQSEHKFRTLFENLAEGVALHEVVQDGTGNTVDYRLLAVNPAYEVHTELKAATAPGRLGTEVYGTEVPPYLAEFNAVAMGGEPYAFETYFPPLDKHFRISVISPTPGQFATVFEDITDRKRREEELQQKNAEMERFTYMISHDLKSPLVTVRTFLGYLEQDLEQGKAERVAKDMGFIRDATGKMGRLLEDLLEVSRVGRVVNPPVRVSLTNLIQEALKAVGGAIALRGVATKAEVPPIFLFGDKPRLEEIWQNLVENAVKYMGDQPAPLVELGVEGLGPEAVFFVRDNGLGIDPRFQGKVFGLFEKLDASSEGTGLGLALVKRIVELHEGRIWLESDGLGLGTCFRFTLPLAMKDSIK